jgi:hypothetical protein
MACHLSEKPETRIRYILNGHITAGDAFFSEAVGLFDAESDHHVLTTIQALGVMSLREASCGRIKESHFLSTQSIHLATEMGLQLNTSGSEDENDTERAVRAVTFWGALSLNEYFYDYLIIINLLLTMDSECYHSVLELCRISLSIYNFQ